MNEFAVFLINDFMSNHTSLYHKMKNTDHFDLKNKYFGNYHVGESVWTHTMMVMNHLMLKLPTFDNLLRLNGSCKHKELLFAALLHDIGKPYAREIDHDRKKTTFHNHEELSTVYAVEVLMDYKNRGFLDEENIVNILTLVNLHILFYSIKSTDVTTKSYRKFIKKISPNHIDQLIALRIVDMLGNNSCDEKGLTVDDLMTPAFVNQLYSDTMKFVVSTIDKKPLVKIMVGLPGSGKSYFLRDEKDPILSRDDIVMELCPELSYTEAFKTVDHKKVDEIFETRFAQYIQKRENFVIDKTNLTRKSRNKLVSRLTKQFNIQFVVMLTPMETIMKRNENREGKTISPEVILSMAKYFTIPHYDEGTGIQPEFVFPKGNK